MKKAMTIRSLVARRRRNPAIRLLGRREGRSLPLILAVAIIVSTTPTGYSLGADQPAGVTSKTPANAAPAATAATSAEPGPAPGAATQNELEELVSPIALYPDLLVARILAASTYPDQVVEAHKWLQENSNLPREQLATQVNAQPWDPSIKSLAQFTPVLQTMNDSLAWTSALGEAYYNQPDDVMKAIQSLRSRAMEAGTLKSTAQQKVEVQPAPPPVASEGVAQPAAQQQTVIIQPAQQDVVYAPQYDPATAYGAPVQAPAGYTGTEMLATGLLSFGAGMALGALINEDDDDWDCDWSDGGGGSVHYNNNVYVSNSPVPPARGNGNYPARPPAANRPGGIGGAGGVGGPGGIGGPGAVGRPGGVGGPGNVGGPGGIGGPGGAGGRPRPGPVRGTNSPNRLAGPSTRPYNPSKAKPYAGVNPNIAKPTFPKASTLPNNPGLGNSKGNLAQNQPLRKANAPPAQPANRMASNRPATANRANSQTRGFGGGADARGGRKGAFGGYQAGGLAQNSSNRGRSSLGGGGFGGRGGRGGGGRGGGGGGGRGGGGGGRRR